MPVKFDSYFRCEKNSSDFLPLTEVIYNQEKLFVSPNIENRNIPIFRKRFFKANIIQAIKNNKRNFKYETFALFNVSSVLAYTIESIKEQAKKLFRTDNLSHINIRFGTPIENVETKLGNAFKSIFLTAVNIYDKYDFFSGYGIDFASIQKELLKTDNKTVRPGWNFSIEPELFAEITSFAATYQANSDYIAVIDIGSSTLDMSFYLRSWLNRNLLTQSVAKVSSLGLTNCQKYIHKNTGGKSHSLSDADTKLNSQFDQDVGDFARYLCEIVFRENEQNVEHSAYYYLFGGGTNNKGMVDKVEYFLNHGVKTYAKYKNARYNLLRGEHIPYTLKDVPASLQIRYQVAIGLARTSSIHIPNRYNLE